MRYFLLAILAMPAFGAPILFLDGVTAPWNATPDQQEQVRAMVASVYTGLNVTVQLTDPGDRADVAWLIIGGTAPMPGEVGQSAINVWHYGTTFRPFGVAFSANVYPDGLSLIDVAEACAHEPGHEFGLFHSTDPTDIMWPYIDGTLHRFNADNRAALKSIVGVSAPEEITPDTAEPGVLLTIGLVYLFSRRHHRHQNERPASSGTSRISTNLTGARASRFSLRAAWSRSVASTYRTRPYSTSATSCSKTASTLYRGIAKA